MKILAIFLLSLSLIFILGPAYAQAPEMTALSSVVSEEQELEEDEPELEKDEQDKDEDKTVVDKINEVTQKVFDRIIKAKEKYKELADFGEKNLSKDMNGFFVIEYETQIPSARGESFPFAFKIAVEPLKTKKSNQSSEVPGYFEYTMPLLELQFSGYAIRHPLRRQFVIEDILDECAEELVDYQQQFMPVRLMIVTEKDTFKVREPIKFKAVLVNASEHNVLVKDLSKETLFFTLNRGFWGTQSGDMEILSATQKRTKERRAERLKRAEMRKALRPKTGKIKTTIGKKTHVGDQLILEAGEAFSIDFEGESYKRAEDIEIRGIYKLDVKGLRPTSKLTIKIVED